MTLKVTYADFEQITRSRSVTLPTGDPAGSLGPHAARRVFATAKPIRFLEVTMSSLEHASTAEVAPQMTLL